jgi:ElaB/YqjD/DUF883 family membrane-anchored ribosome-binding protein
MTQGNGQAAAFVEHFDKLVPLIRDEWPTVDGDALQQTKGDYDLVVTLIAEQTEHTRALVRKQLDELSTMVPGGQASDIARLRHVVERLQARSQEIAGYVKGQMLKDAKQKVSDNPLVALLMALGFGLILGFLLRGGGSRERR